MLIRSQNKKGIVNLDNIIEIGANDTKIVCAGTYGYVGSLGIYSTEEKAIKVLDMICEAFKDFRGGNVYEHSVFQMPQDSEV